MEIYDATSTYVHLDTGPDATPIPVDEQFWATINDRDDLARGRLVMASVVAADWTSWEMHPDGDEVIQVNDGVVRISIEVDGVVSPTVVHAPNFVVMPAGRWHTMDVVEAARVVTITWGAGTQHRAR